MNENEIYIVEDYLFDNLLITEIDSILDNCFKDCHNKYFHTFNHECIYVIKLTNITKNEIINLTIGDKSMNLCDLNKKLRVARRK